MDFFREGTKPDRPYSELRVLYTDNWAGEEEEATNDLIAKARKLGANAIIMVQRVEGDYKWNAFGRSGRRYTYKAIAITYGPTK